MTMSPGTPFAGSDVLFKVIGLEPWDVLEVEFLGPGGQAAPWITDEHYTGSWSNNYFLSDDDGSAQWVRYGAQDEVGDWSARIRIDDSLRIVNYSYTKFSLPRLVHARLGVPLFGCRSDEAVIFFSDSVNFAVTVDMHAELEFASDLLEERLGIRTAELPVIYLLGNQADFHALTSMLPRERRARSRDGRRDSFVRMENSRVSLSRATRSRLIFTTG